MKKTFTLILLVSCYFSTLSQNRALNFDGIDDYVRIDENPSLPTTAMTVEMWINPGAVAYPSVVISKGQTSTSSYYVIFCSSSDFVASPTWRAGSNLTFDLFTSTGGNRLSYQLPIDISDSWHHVAITYDGAEKRLYLDGALVGQQLLTGTINTNQGSPLIIGNLEPNYTNSFKGTIDELRIWNVARTASEISENYRTEIEPNTPVLAAYYRFNQGVPGGNNVGLTTLEDAKTVAHNGRLWNFALTESNTSNWVGGFPFLDPLPIKITSFNVYKDGNVVSLNWKILMNSEASSFEVERSTNGRNFSKVGSVTASQTIRNEENYLYIDRQPLDGTSYYRLKILETNGNVIYTAILRVKMEGGTSISIYPNPTGNTLRLQTSEIGKISVLIRDAMQRSVKILQLTSNSNRQITSIDITNLHKGVYYLHANDEVIKFIKQ